MGRKTLCWQHLRLGPPKPPGLYLYARICQRCPATFQPPHTHHTSRLKFPTHTAKLRHQNKIYKRARHLRTTKQKRKAIHTVSQRDSSLPRTWFWHHYSNTTQHHCVTTIQTYDNKHEENAPTSRLCCHTKIIRPKIFTHTYDTSHTQQHRISQQNRGMQPGYQPRFLVKHHSVPTKKWRHTHHWTDHK